MMENEYKVTTETETRKIELSVFTESEDKNIIKELAIIKTVEFMDELGIKIDASEVNPIGYKRVKQFVN